MYKSASRLTLAFSRVIKYNTKMYYSVSSENTGGGTNNVRQTKSGG